MSCNPRWDPRRCAAWLLVVAAAVVMLPTPAHGQSVKNVLFLTAESPDLPANRAILDGIQTALRREFPARVEFSVEAIDARPFPNDIYERRFADLLSEKFRGVRLDLVIAVTQPAVDFVLREHDRLFASAPLLLGFIEARTLDQRALPDNAGVVFLKVDAASSVRLAIRTNPSTRRVLVVGGTSRFDRGWEQIVRTDLATLDAGISIEYDTNSSLDDLVRHVADLPADAVVLFTSATRDGANAPVRSIDVIQRLHAVARVPIFGVSSTFLGHGIVGGTVLDFDRHGQDLAQRAVQLLRGQKPVPITTVNTTVVDWRQLQRFGIRTDTLPASTAIAFRELTIWERHWAVIISVGVVVVAQAALIAALVTLIRRRRETQRLLEDRLRLERRLSELSLSLTAAPPESMASAFEAALSRIAGALGADWLWRWEPGAPEDDDWRLPATPNAAPVTCETAADLPATIRQRLLAAGGERASAIAVPLSHDDLASGALFWVSRRRPMSQHPRPDDLKIVATIVGNVLRRRKAEAAFAQSDRLRGAILDSLPAQVAVLDRDGTIIAINDSGMAPGEGSGVSPTATLAPGASYLDGWAAAAQSGVENAAAALAVIERACNGRRSEDQIEYLAEGPDGARWLLMSAEPLRRPEGGAVIIHMDITPRKLTEIALRETEGRFRRLADGLPIAIWMSEADGRLSYVNERWLRMTGRTLEDEVGDGWLGLVHPDDQDACARAFFGDRGQPQGFSVDYRLRQPDGQYRWLMNVGTPRIGADAAFHGYVGGCIDITERREAEQMQRDLNIRLILAREEERRHIARELHDHLNQQLALLAIDIQQLTMKPPESADALRQALQRAWQRTADIASDVHGISHRLHPSKLEALGLVATIRGHCRDVSRQSLQVHFTEQGAPSKISADVSLCLFRVVEEALSNARRHSSATEATVTLVDTAAEIVLRVSDSGCGFSRAGAPAHGIGLVSMRERLHALGGTLVITSSPGRGTVVEARIPRVSPAERTSHVSTVT